MLPLPVAVTNVSLLVATGIVGWVSDPNRFMRFMYIYIYLLIFKLHTLKCSPNKSSWDFPHPYHENPSIHPPNATRLHMGFHATQAVPFWAIRWKTPKNSHEHVKQTIIWRSISYETWHPQQPWSWGIWSWLGLTCGALNGALVRRLAVLKKGHIEKVHVWVSWFLMFVCNFGKISFGWSWVCW